MSKNIPTNKALYARVKAEAKKKFDRWPSAYGSAWLVKEYKRRGGTYRKAQLGTEVQGPPEMNLGPVRTYPGDFIQGPEQLVPKQIPFDAAPPYTGMGREELLQRQAYQESRFKPRAESPKGYKGATQIGEDIMSDYEKATGDTRHNPFNPAYAVDVQRWAMGKYMDNTDWIKGSPRVKQAKALAAYNWGPGNTLDFLNDAKASGVDIYSNDLEWIKGMPAETRKYINHIMGLDYSDEPNWQNTYKEAKDTSEVAKLYDFAMGGMMYSDTDLPSYKSGGIPTRYRNMGFTKVGAKKKSTRPGKKWMVLAKKGDKYKIVHGGDSNMKDFKQHGSAKRKKRFWDRMGGRNSAKAKDPFSPLYWHKRFGTWAEGGEFEPHMMYDPETGKGFMADQYQDHVRMDKMGFTHDAPEMGYGGKKYGKGGINNPGFRALPPEVQDKIRANMKMGGIPEYQDAGTTYLPPAIRNMYPKEDPIYYDGMLNETTVTAPKYEGPQIRRATKDELAPVNSNFMFMGADKSGGLRALRAIGKGVKGLLGLKGAADEVAAGFNYAKGYGNPYQNMQISDDMFKGVANYGEDITGEIAKGRLDFVRGLGKELDDMKFDANWVGPEHLRFHGTPGGRSVVEVAVPGKTHQTQLFYKSSGGGGKPGAGVNGTTQGLWQPYGGHAGIHHPYYGYIPEWFIKGDDYVKYYNSKAFKDIAGRLDDLTKQAGFDMSGQVYEFKYGGSKPCFECGGTMKYGGTPKYQFAGTAGMNPFTQEEEEYMQQTYGTPADPTASMELPTLDLSLLENMVYENVPEEMDNFEFIPGRSDNMRTTKNWMMQTEAGKLPTFTHKSGKKFNLDKAFKTVDALSGLAGMAGRNAKRSRQLQQNKQRQFTDNLYDPIRAGEIGSRGDYNISGQFRPDRVANWNPYMAESFNTTPFYQEGGVTEMTDAEIERLRAMGADIEILD